MTISASELLVQRLKGSTRSSTAVASLVGDGWQRYWRILHPAVRIEGGHASSVPWADVARIRGVAFDPARSTWREVSGVEPHTDQLPQGIDVEPTEGADDKDLQRVVVQALVRAARDRSVALAQWTGYGDAVVPRGAENVVIERERYSVVTVEAPDAPLPGFRANFAMGDSGLWLSAADMDLMSTYIGVAEGMDLAWPSSLEAASCDAWDPVS